MTENSRETIPSPEASGGAGDVFEQHVCAFALSLLLVRGIPPVLVDSSVVEVHFQVRQRGWRTDDLLIVGETSSGGRRNLAMQVKRSLTVSAGNEEFRQTIQSMWDDFSAESVFDRSTDCVAVVTLRGTNALLHHFRSLLECARASCDSDDFVRRVGLDGYLSNKAKEQDQAVRQVLGKHLGREVQEDEYWRFLRAVQILSLDLGSSTGQAEAIALSQLGHFANDSRDPVAGAANAWNALLAIAGRSRGSATSFKYEDLPEDLRSRYATLGGGSRGGLQELIEHGQTVVAGIGSSLGGGVEIDRGRLCAGLLSKLEQHQIVLVSGPAGSGKSAIAKDAVGSLRIDTVVLAFQGMELGVPHIDEVLARAQSPLNAQGLRALLAAQDRKVVLIEGVERLLERSVRDAFSQLLAVARDDPSLKIILTCRDYSLETMRTSMLGAAGVSCAVHQVPPLSDADLAFVESRIPSLSAALRKPALRSLLRSPYLLAMAARLDWNSGDLPASERAFRERCWREVIRAEHYSTGGLPDRRAEVFLDVAHRRALELCPFVEVRRSDAAALESLCQDGLIIRSPDSATMAAPAHDVLEDWAIIRWLYETHAHAGSRADLANAIGSYPALRRGYRAWLGERLTEGGTAAREFVLEAVSDNEVPEFFKDDSLVAALLSDGAGELVRSWKPALLADGAALLLRVIRTLRLACKASPPWLNLPALPSSMLVPRGKAWEGVLAVVADSLSPLISCHKELLLGLVEDWSKSVGSRLPMPPGAEDAGPVALALAREFDDYQSNDQQKRALQVVFKVPRSVGADFVQLLNRAHTRSRRRTTDDRIDEHVAELALGGFTSSWACREYPREVFELVNARLRLTLEELEHTSRFSTYAVDESFGIRPWGMRDFFPPSAIQGPFWCLLGFHSDAAVQFIVEFLNHSAAWYVTYGQLEPAIEITVRVSETEEAKQIFNDRLFVQYRGLSVGPDVVRSALMALEKHLLSLARTHPDRLEDQLLGILRSSNNVMAAGVIASVATAFPVEAGRAAIALLSSKELVLCDRARMAAESPLAMGLFGGMNPEKAVFEEERKEANGLEHRKNDLESVALKLQFTEMREEVWAVLDRHYLDISGEGESESSHVWRLALHRMDVRDYERVEPPEWASDEGSDPGERRVYYGPASLDADVQQMVDQSSANRATVERHLGLLNGARNAWRERSSVEGGRWRDLLSEGMLIESEIGEPDTPWRGGAGLIAAVCVRDHLEELGEEERQWCQARVDREVRTAAAHAEGSVEAQRSASSPEGECASVVPLLVAAGRPEDEEDLRDLLSLVLTHPRRQLAEWAFAGLGAFLGDSKKSLVLHCVAAPAYRARLVSELYKEDSERPLRDRIGFAGLAERATPLVRSAIKDGVLGFEHELSAIDLNDWHGADAMTHILSTLVVHPEWEEARVGFARAAAWLAETWTRRRSASDNPERNYEFEYGVSEKLARFALKLPVSEAVSLCRPLLGIVSESPREVADFLRDLIVAADQSSDDCFWDLWQHLADEALDAHWCSSLGRRRPTGEEFIARLFLAIEWKEGVRDWHRLSGNAHRLEQLALALPAARVVLQGYARFLTQIGQASLPSALISVCEILERDDCRELAANEDVAFYLENALRQFVYSQPHQLKSVRELRTAVLKILDALVAGGSAAAYMMRDDFVTPAPPVAAA